MITHSSTQTSTSDVLQASETVLVDFYAEWCGPCKAMMPTLESFASEHATVKVVKVNVDENSELAEQYNIFSIPTLMVFRGGQVVTQMIGAQSKEALVAAVGK